MKVLIVSGYRKGAKNENIELAKIKKWFKATYSGRVDFILRDETNLDDFLYESFAYGDKDWMK